MSNSNQEPITVKQTETGGFDVEFHYNGYQFEVGTSRDMLKCQAQNQVETDQLLHILEGILDKLKTEVIIDKTFYRLKGPGQPHDHQPSDDP